MQACLHASSTSCTSQTHRINVHTLPCAAVPPVRCRQRCKPPLIPRTEVPVMGMISDTDYVTVNAVKNIASKPPRKDLEVSFVCKPGYGETPLYLTSIKAQVAKANQLMEEERRRQAISQAPKAKQLPEEERQELLRQLKRKWGTVNAVFQTLPVVIDTLSKNKQKEDLSRQLASIERDIRLLSRSPIFVVDDTC